EVLAQWAAAAARRFDFDETKKRLDALDAVSPGSAGAYLAVGKSMASARQYDEAATYLQTAAERAPKWPAPVIELGLSELQAGRNRPQAQGQDGGGGVPRPPLVWRADHGHAGAAHDRRGHGPGDRDGDAPRRPGPLRGVQLGPGGAARVHAHGDAVADQEPAA